MSITLAGLCVSPVTMVIPGIVREESRTGGLEYGDICWRFTRTFWALLAFRSYAPVSLH